MRYSILFNYGSLCFLVGAFVCFCFWMYFAISERQTPIDKRPARFDFAICMLLMAALCMACWAFGSASDFDAFMDYEAGFDG